MKVAVTSRGSALSSELDPRFGRAEYFVVLDTDSGDFIAYDNSSNLRATQGAGIQTARDIIGLGVETLITGNIGPKAEAALRAGNVKIYRQNCGTVRDAFEWFESGHPW